MQKVSRLQFITTSPALAQNACEGGVDWIQLRLKNTGFEAYVQVALAVRDVCSRFGATLIINDNVAVAKAVNADGVHLGKTDMSPLEARQILGPDKIIGCTANTLEDIIAYASLPVDYVGLGPFRFTATKENLSPILGLDGYGSIMKEMARAQIRPMPVVAIGGILVTDVPAIMNCGLWGIAVSGAISACEDVTGAATAFTKSIKENTAS